MESSWPNRLKVAFCAAVMALAVFQFSENTVDPDLWGHVVFGRQMLHTGTIPKIEPYSWTANGRPWINHEWLAEIVLGKVHLLAGGTGLLLLKMLMGLAAFAICLRIGMQSLSGAAKLIAWAFGAVAVVEISFGFAARPQIFTALFLAIELLLLHRFHSGKRWPALALPFLFLAWINFHGGVLAGLGLLGLTAITTTAQRFKGTRDAGGAHIFLWLAVAASLAALFVNPWKSELLRWLVGSVLWSRPEIAEWNPTRFNADHIAFFIVLLLTIAAWLFTRRPRVWWELAACASFAVLGCRAERNAPLFCLVALALVPPHLASALTTIREHSSNLETAARTRTFQVTATIALAVAAIATGLVTFTLHKEHPLTMESPRSQYPTAAISFLRDRPLTGKMLTFFDWGEMVIFELPDCPVSIDGRLDTCYPRDLIAAHWRLYNGQPLDEKILPIDEADLALLPTNLAGTAALAHRPGWVIVYEDSLATVLARDPSRFPSLKALPVPVVGGREATTGREPFPTRAD